MRLEVPYYRQFPSGPTIFVKNGFLDIGSAFREGGLDEELPIFHRTKSAPAGLALQTLGDEAEVDTEAGSDSNSSGSGGTAPPSPWRGPDGPPAQQPPGGPVSTKAALVAGPAAEASPAPRPSTAAAARASAACQPAAPVAGTSPLPCIEPHVAAVHMGMQAAPAAAAPMQQMGFYAGFPADRVHSAIVGWSLLPAAAVVAPHDGTYPSDMDGAPWMASQPTLHMSQQAPVPMLSDLSLLPPALVSPQLTPQVSPIMSPMLSPQLSPPLSPLLSAQLEPQLESQFEFELQIEPQSETQPSVLASLWPPAQSSSQALLQPSRQASPQVSQQASPQLSPQPSPQLSPQPSPQLSPSLCPVDSHAELGSGFLPPQARSIVHEVNAVSGVHRILWRIDAGKLRGHERQTVSPSFDLPLGSPVSFRLVIFPKPNSDGKGSASFRKASGRGSVLLKCEACRGTVTFYVSIGEGRQERSNQPRGPVTFDFARHSTCGLPKGSEQWDFGSVVDEASQTFTVCLDILPHSDT